MQEHQGVLSQKSVFLTALQLSRRATWQRPRGLPAAPPLPPQASPAARGGRLGPRTCRNACTCSQSSAPAGCRVQWSDGWLMMGARKASPKEDLGNDRRQKCIWLRCGAQVGSDTPGEQRARWERRRGILNVESGPGTHHAAHAPAHACWGIRLQH